MSEDNAFVTDIGSFIGDPQKHPLPEYMFYSPNLDDDGHDPTSNPQEGLKKASDWLRMFLTTWLHFDDTTWVPKDEQMKRTLVIVTFDESEGNNKPERIYTVFLGAMVKPQEVTAAYNHYSVLRTIEDNFGLDSNSQTIRRRHRLRHHWDLEVVWAFRPLPRGLGIGSRPTKGCNPCTGCCRESQVRPDLTVVRCS